MVAEAASGQALTGKLRVSLSFLRPGYDVYHSSIYLCTGTTTFTAPAG